MGKKQAGGRLIAIACTAALLLTGVAHAHPQADGTVEAVWKPLRFNFVYSGYNTLYSCGGLQDKLEKILTSVGARAGSIELRTYSCDDASSIARFEIALASPVEATPQNVQELSSHDARDELVARVNGKRVATAEDLPRFPAVWKTISFARSREMRLAPGDCELVQQLRREILPRMSVQIVNDHLRCSAFGNIGRPQLVVSALVPVAELPD